MNKVILVGRLARDPELRTTPSGKSVCTFSVAVDRRYKTEGQPTADFIPVVAWGRQAEVINQYLAKGRQIALSGRIAIRSYDANDGSKRYITEVVLEEFDFIGDRGNNAGGGQNYSQNYSGSNFGGNNYNNAGGHNQYAAGQSDLPLDDDFHLLADDEDVPF